MENIDKRCPKCKTTKNSSEFYKDKSRASGLHPHCKSCFATYTKKSDAKRYKSTKLNYYVVYYLPNENYCGITTNPESRMREHKARGKNVEGWKVLYTSADVKEAYYHESLFHGVLGMEGLKTK